jgi:hypothetical protein
MLGLVWGSVLISIITIFINTHYTSKFIDYSIINQLLDIMPSILKAIIIGAIVYMLDHYIFIQMLDIYRLIFSSIIYLTIYFGLAFLMKSKEIFILLDLIKGTRNKASE